MKLPLIIFVLLNLLVFTLLKNVLMIPFLIRLFERVSTWFTTKVLMMIFSSNAPQLYPHAKHSSFNFIAAQRGEQTVDESSISNGLPTLLLCNHASLLDYLYLSNRYTPLYTKVVFYKALDGSQKAGIRELSMWEVFTHSFMIQFPQIEDKTYDFSEGNPVL